MALGERVEPKTGEGADEASDHAMVSKVVSCGQRLRTGGLHWSFIRLQAVSHGTTRIKDLPPFELSMCCNQGTMAWICAICLSSDANQTTSVPVDSKIIDGQWSSLRLDEDGSHHVSHQINQVHEAHQVDGEVSRPYVTGVQGNSGNVESSGHDELPAPLALHVQCNENSWIRYPWVERGVNLHRRRFVPL